MRAVTLAEAKERLGELLDEAIAGEDVTIARDGAAVVSLTPSPPTPRPLTLEDIAGMRARALARPGLGADAVTLVRQMRDDDP